jgi:hypothetical protein
MKSTKLFFIILIIIISIIIFSYIKTKKEGYTNNFGDKQIDYYEDRPYNVGLPLNKDPEKFLKVTDKNKLEDNKDVLTTSKSGIDNLIQTCNKIKKCDDISPGCGYCLSSKKGMVGNKDGPTVDTCASGWVSTQSDCKKVKERILCSKVKNCKTMVGDYSICGWSPSKNKAIPATLVNNKLVPKYKEDKDVTDLFSYEDCAKAGSCLKTWNGTGHSKECLQELWTNAGCSTSGKSSPYVNYNQNSWWSRQSIKRVVNDMANYKKYADSNDYNVKNNYYPRCYGKDIPNPCSSEIYNNPLQCYQKTFVDTGCLKKGSSYPNVKPKVSLEDYKKSITTMIANSHNTSVDFNTRNKSYTGCYGGEIETYQKEFIDVDNGLNAYVYNTRDWRGYPSTPLRDKPVRIKNLRHWWGSGKVFGIKRDRIYVTIKGYIKYPPGKSTVRYRVGSDDGSSLYINGKNIIYNWGLHGFRWRYSGTQTINSTADQLSLYMFEHGGHANLILQWSLDGGQWEHIPDEAFVSSKINKQETGFDKSHYIMYGPWFASRRKPVTRVFKENGADVYMTDDVGFTKIVKVYGNNAIPYYYRGNTNQYAYKHKIRAPQGVYKVLNVKTNKVLGS